MFSMFDRLFLGALLVVWLCCATMLVRLAIVDSYRSSVLRSVSACAKADIAAGREWRWRYDEWRAAASFDEMMHQPWKPPSWFFSGKTFHRCDEAQSAAK